jgi:hypothetical protein
MRIIDRMVLRAGLAALSLLTCLQNANAEGPRSADAPQAFIDFCADCHGDDAGA